MFTLDVYAVLLYAGKPFFVNNCIFALFLGPFFLLRSSSHFLRHLGLAIVSVGVLYLTTLKAKPVPPPQKPIDTKQNQVSTLRFYDLDC